MRPEAGEDKIIVKSDNIGGSNIGNIGGSNIGNIGRRNINTGQNENGTQTGISYTMTIIFTTSLYWYNIVLSGKIYHQVKYTTW